MNPESFVRRGPIHATFFSFFFFFFFFLFVVVVFLLLNEHDEGRGDPKTT